MIFFHLKFKKKSKDKLVLLGASLCQPFNKTPCISRRCYRIYHSIKSNKIEDNEPV